MTTYKPGDVVLVPFPFTDLSTTKQRPAVILSSARFNGRSKDCIIAAITSHIPVRREPGDYLLSPPEQKRAGLPKESLVKTGKIVTLEQTLIRKQLGTVPPSTKKRLIEIFVKILG